MYTYFYSYYIVVALICVHTYQYMFTSDEFILIKGIQNLDIPYTYIDS